MVSRARFAISAEPTLEQKSANKRSENLFAASEILFAASEILFVGAEILFTFARQMTSGAGRCLRCGIVQTEFAAG